MEFEEWVRLHCNRQKQPISDWKSERERESGAKDRELSCEKECGEKGCDERGEWKRGIEWERGEKREKMVWKREGGKSERGDGKREG